MPRNQFSPIYNILDSQTYPCMLKHWLSRKYAIYKLLIIICCWSHVEDLKERQEEEMNSDSTCNYLYDLLMLPIFVCFKISNCKFAIVSQTWTNISSNWIITFQVINAPTFLVSCNDEIRFLREREIKSFQSFSVLLSQNNWRILWKAMDEKYSHEYIYFEVENAEVRLCLNN